MFFKGGMGSKNIVEPERKMEGELNSFCRWSEQLDRRTGHRMEMGQQGLGSSELQVPFVEFRGKNHFLS